MKRTGLVVLRAKNGLTQGQIAETLGVSMAYYNTIENCNREGGNKFWNTLQSKYNLTAKEMYEIRINAKF